MDSKKLQTILRRGMDKVMVGIQNNLNTSGRNASGKTSKSLRITSEITASTVKVTLLGSSVLEQLEFGRGKTKNAGNSATWEKELRDWMRIRGIDQSAFYPIWRKINAEGYKGTNGLVTNPVDVFKKEIGEKLKLVIVQDFKRDGINSNQ